MRAIQFFSVAIVAFGVLGLNPVFGQLDSRSVGEMKLEMRWSSPIQRSLHEPGQGSFLLWQSSQPAKKVVEVAASGQLVTLDPLALGEDGKAIGMEGVKAKADLIVKRMKYAGLRPVVSERTSQEIWLVNVAQDGAVQMMDAETGVTKWSLKVGSYERPTLLATVNDEHVVVTNGSHVFLIDAKTGKLKESVRSPYSPGAGAFSTPTRVFIPSLNGYIVSYDLGNMKREPWRALCLGRVLVPSAFNRTTRVAAVVTDANKTYFVDTVPRIPEMMFRLETAAVVHATPVAFENLFVVAASNGEIFAVDSTNGGKLAWSATVGTDVMESPIVTKEAVFLVTEEGRLVALQTADGQVAEGWEGDIRGLQHIFAVTPTRIYAATISNQLIAIDRKTGNQIGKPIGKNLKRSPVNRINDRLYLTTSDGSLQCYQEIASTEPVFHQQLEVAPTDSAKKPDAKTPAAEVPAEETTEGADPFGIEEPSAAAPAGDEMPAGDDGDPFGDGQ